MLIMDKSLMEGILSKLQTKGCLFPQYEFYRENNQLCLLGVGGFSSVYDMVDKNNPQKHYAIKVIGFEKHTVTTEEFQKNILLQRKLSEQTSHIVRIIDSVQLYVFLNNEGDLQQVELFTGENVSGDGMLLQFILMEKLEPVLFKDKFRNVVLTKSDLAREDEILRFAKQIGQAIMIAHENNILHRDIKLENIFWDSEEKQYKLGDFGIAKYVEDGTAETVVYTDGYGAPEIEKRLHNNYNATADIYSFGITLYLLFNDLKFPGSEGYRASLVQYSENFIFPAPEKSPVEYTRIIRKMCSFHREDRYQSMAEVLSKFDVIPDLEKNSIEDLDNLTETFKEEKIHEENSDISKSESQRMNRKQEERMLRLYYEHKDKRFFVLLSLLFMLLFQGISSNTSVVFEWGFFILPTLLLLEAFTLKLKELQGFFTLITVLFGIYSIYETGVYIPQLIMILCGLSGVWILAAAGAVGNGLWLVLALYGTPDWIRMIGNTQWLWIILIVIVLLIDRLMINQCESGNMPYQRAYMWWIGMRCFALGSIVGGTALAILQYFQVMRFPEILNQTHLFRVGVILLIMFYIEIRLDTIDEEEEENVYMDE